jgi:glycosyltransferase involved in cell wall biosynthesis
MEESVRGEVRSVLMTADAMGGVWTFAVELCAALGARGLRTTLAVMGPPPSAAQRAEVRSIPGLSLASAPWQLEWMDDPWADVDGAAAWLLALEREARPEVIHLNGYAHGCVPFFAPVVVVGHSCVLSWFDQVKGTAAPPLYDQYRRRAARGLRCAAAVVVPSTVMSIWLQRFYGPLRSCRVIYNAERPAPACPALKEPFVLAAGRMWDEAKNLEALCSAAVQVRWPVKVAGEVRRRDGAVWEARGVDLLGPLPKHALLSTMTRASIFAAPALYEPFGLAVLEAAMAGCALVLADIPSFRELWDGCADFVDPRDPASLAAGLDRLIADPLRRAAFAARARVRAAQFSVARMADTYLDTYRSAGRDPRGAAA